MKKILPLLLLSSSASFAALTPAGGELLTDYTNWFQPFRVAADSNVSGIPRPRSNFPNATQADTAFRDWSGFMPNWGATGLTAPTVARSVTIEAVFLGESAGWWNDWGYTLNGSDYLLADGAQALGGRNILFGDHAFITLNAGDSIDFFVTGSGVRKQDGKVTLGANGGKFYTYDEALNTGGSLQQSYVGTIDPLASVTGTGTPLSTYYVLAFEDTRLTTRKSDRDYNDFLFAFRYLPSAATAVPEPATFGALGAALLLGGVMLRHRSRSR